MTYILIIYFFFFNDTATTEIYTLSLHDALPISGLACDAGGDDHDIRVAGLVIAVRDRKSTRLNSSHANISYAVFCLKKKKKNNSMSRKRKESIITCTPRTRLIRQTFTGTNTTDQ